MATVKGTYNGPITFTRGGVGKFTDGMVTNFGLCFPKVCSEKEVRSYTESLITSQAVGANWDVDRIDYHMASKYDEEQISTTSPWTLVFAGILGLALFLVFLGTLVELSMIGDVKQSIDKQNNLKPIDQDLLSEASRFRRLIQYDSILIQRKSKCMQFLLQFSLIRNMVLLNILPRQLRSAIKLEESEI